MLLRVREFGGMVPKVDEKLLPENCAVDAINTDLQSTGIEPMYAPLFKRNAGVPLALAAASVVQFPTACLATVGAYNSSAGYVRFAPIDGNYLVVANDQLVYAVFLPAGTTSAGQGCVDVHCTSGAFLGNINDQNAIGSRDGDLTARAQGQWYLRAISLASIVGLTIDEFRFLHNYTSTDPLTAFLGVAYIRNNPAGNVLKKVLFDVDEQSVGTNVGNLLRSVITTIDEDEAPLVSTFTAAFNGLNVEADSVYAIAHAQISGLPRAKTILVQSYPQNVGSLGSPGNYPIRGWSGHDRFGAYDTGFPIFGSVVGTEHSLHTRYSWLLTGGQINAIGWMGVTKPTAAMSLAVAGGAAPTVTRSYVYTRVSEDGFESAPSPPVTVTGNRDGTWELTNVTSWPGTDAFSGGRNPAAKRIYRTPEGSATYRFMAEVAATVTTVNDTALDAALGEDLATTHYDDAPQLTFASTWQNGLVGGIASGTQVCFCDPSQYHAWPQANRYTIPYVAVATGVVGDRFVALTINKPVWFSGASPDDLAWAELESGEPCISAKGVVQSAAGLIYPGRTGWGLVSYSGAENITKEFLKANQYAAIVGVDTVALFDNRKLFWITQAGTTGYAFEFGAGARSLTKFEVPDPIYAMSYYAPRDTRWFAYTNGGVLKMGKLFADTTQKLKWTWKSKLHRFPKPVRLNVAQIDSNEWDSLSASMKAREAAYLTGGGGAPYSISITGLTQAEPWCYLKVWCEADKGANAVLVFDDFVVSDRPVGLARVMKSDCWQFEIRGNMAITQIAFAESESELNQE